MGPLLRGRFLENLFNCFDLRGPAGAPSSGGKGSLGLSSLGPFLFPPVDYCYSTSITYVNSDFELFSFSFRDYSFPALFHFRQTKNRQAKQRIVCTREEAGVASPMWNRETGRRLLMK